MCSAVGVLALCFAMICNARQIQLSYYSVIYLHNRKNGCKTRFENRREFASRRSDLFWISVQSLLAGETLGQLTTSGGTNLMAIPLRLNEENSIVS